MSEQNESKETELLVNTDTSKESSAQASKETELSAVKKKKSKMPFIIIGTILLIGIAVFIAFMVANAKPERKAAKELELARQYLDEMNYEMSIASYTKVVEIDPKNVEAYEGLANTYVAMAEEAIIAGDIDVAIEYYENAIEALEQGEAETGDEGLAELLETVQEMKQEAEQQNQPVVESENIPENNGNTNEDGGESATDLTCMTAEEIMQASVGDVVTYGTYGITYRSYEWNDDYTLATETGKNSNPETPIEWIVLANDGGSVTLLSKYVLDIIPYNPAYKPITWEDSEIRAWLNNDFYNIAFTDVEKTHIQTTSCVNEDNPYYGVAGGHGHYQPGEEHYPAGGNTTQDKVYLLSLAEIEQYFGVTVADWGSMSYAEKDTSNWSDDDWSNMWSTYGDYCNNKSGGILVAENPAAGGAWWWWLRSPGCGSLNAAGVSCSGGGVDLDGGLVSDFEGVRPALKISL